MTSSSLIPFFAAPTNNAICFWVLLFRMESVRGILSDSVYEVPSSSSSEFHEEENRVQGPIRSQDQQHQRQWHPSVLLSLDVPLLQVMPTIIRYDACFAFIVLVAFWIFACTTVILGFYGPSNIQLGPNCSRLIKANPFFVQSIKTREIHESIYGPMLYGFHQLPSLDVKITWSETHDAFVESRERKEWQYFLNQGSKIHISYRVNCLNAVPLLLVISRGRESLAEWIEDRLYPNTTLSRNIIHGTGILEQEIWSSETYRIALANFNFKKVEVQLNFTIKALVYNTTQAYYKCSLSHHLCTLKLYLSGVNAALLTSTGSELGMANYKCYVKLSYGQRWITYFVGSVSVTVLVLVAIRIVSTYVATRGYGAGFQSVETGTEGAPFLSPKDDDLSSWCSSSDSTSRDEEEFTESLVAVPDGKQLEGECINDHRRLCVVCLDALRDCFFLPCGHCAACFTCGTRAIEEAGVCPVCHRAMKKVRKIFSV